MLYLVSPHTSLYSSSITSTITESRATGSPNGQAVGYFLSQHKHRFGKNKSVGKITVFKPDVGQTTYMLFWIIDAPTTDAEAGFAHDDAEQSEVTSTEVFEQIGSQEIQQAHMNRNRGS